MNGITTVYVGNHYEVKNNIVTKYYFAGATRLAVRTDGTLRFLLGDHIGSSSVTTNASGAKTASALYREASCKDKAFGETRYALGNLSTDYKFTGQREEASLGIYFFNARWYDGSLGRFLSPDSIVPTSTQGTQAWDRYAFVNNNPVRYTDPTGHILRDEEKDNEDEDEEDTIEYFDETLSAEEVTDLLIEIDWWLVVLKMISDGLGDSALLEIAGVSTIGAFIFAPAAPLALITGGVAVTTWMTEKTLDNTITDLSELRYQIAVRSGAEFDEAINTVVAKKSITLSMGSNIVNWNVKVNGDKVIEHSNVWLFPIATEPLNATPLWFLGFVNY